MRLQYMYEQILYTHIWRGIENASGSCDILCALSMQWQAVSSVFQFLLLDLLYIYVLVPMRSSYVLG